MVLLLTIGVIFCSPAMFSLYSAPYAYIHQGDRVRVCGRAVYENGTPAASIVLTLFATDELIEENVTTSPDGRFFSVLYYEAGQVITVTYEGVFLYPYYDGTEQPYAFVDYDVHEDAYLGQFVIPQGLTP